MSAPSPSIVRHRMYGKTSNPTVYYLTGYGGTLKRYAPHIRSFVLAGFRVVAFEYDKAVLDAGNPDLLLAVLKDIVRSINEDKKSHTVAGVYGVSLGSWLGANVLVECDIRVGMFNTGGGTSITAIVWDNPRFASARKAYEQHGHTRSSLERRWDPYEFTAKSGRWRGKHVLIMASTGDEVIDFSDVRRNMAAWQQGGDKIQLIVSNRFRHAPVILRNMLRVRKTPEFFKRTQRL